MRKSRQEHKERIEAIEIVGSITKKDMFHSTLPSAMIAPESGMLGSSDARDRYLFHFVRKILRM